MTLLNWFNQKPITQHRFDDEDRKASIELRAKRKELELERLNNDILLEQKRKELMLVKLQNEIDEEQPEDNNPLSKLKELSSLLPMLTGLNQNALSPQNTNPPIMSNAVSQPVEIKQHLTEEQIQQIWNDIPFFLKRSIKKKSDEEIKEYIISYMPNIDEESIKCALAIARA